MAKPKCDVKYHTQFYVSSNGITWMAVQSDPGTNSSWRYLRREVTETTDIDTTPEPHPGEKVLERIQAKAQKHYDAGREYFKQVFVSKKDWTDLDNLLKWTKGQVRVYTVIGIVSVWPLNDDGVTFVD